MFCSTSHPDVGPWFPPVFGSLQFLVPSGFWFPSAIGSFPPLVPPLLWFPVVFDLLVSMLAFTLRTVYF